MRKILLAILWVAVALVAAFNVAILLGMRLPIEHTATRSLRVKASGREVWSALTDYSQEPKWRDDLKSVERLPDRSGIQVWQEHYKNGMSQNLATDQFVPPVFLVRSIADENGPVAGSWDFTLINVPGGTLVKLTERARIRNPFYRFMSRYVIKQGPMEKFLRQLAARVGDKDAPIT